MSDSPRRTHRAELRNSVFWRLAGILIGAQVAIGVFALLFSALFAYNESLGLIDNSIRLQLDRLAEEVEGRANLDGGVDDLPPDLLVDLTTRFPDPIKIISIDGSVAHVLHPNPLVFAIPEDRGNDYPLPPDVVDLLYNDDITIELDERISGSWGLAPIYDSSGLVAGGLVVQPLAQSKRSELAGARRAYTRALIVVTIVAGLLALLIGALLTWRLIKPLRRFTDRVERIRDGDFKARVEDYSTDEFGRLAESINDMAGQVEQSIETLRSADALRRELVANVGHDLRTPLTAIRGYVDEAQRFLDEGQPGKSADALNIASRQGRYLTQLVDDLFELSVLGNSGQSLKLEPVPMAELLNDSARAHRGQFEKDDITFGLELAADLPVVQADGVRLLRLLDNLLSNARHHVPPEGEVFMRATATATHVSIDVSDNGEGMSAADAESIFDRYYRGDGPRTRGIRGTGLGLPISRAIAEAHGGELSVNTIEGEGSTFSIRLPVNQPDDD